MAFQRKLLSLHIREENARYRALTIDDTKACKAASLHELRRALAMLRPLQALPRVDGAAAYEAMASEMIERGDYPRLKDGTGRVWT